MSRILVLSWVLLNVIYLSFKNFHYGNFDVSQNNYLLFSILWRENFFATYCNFNWRCFTWIVMFEFWNDKYVLLFRHNSMDDFLSERLLKTSDAHWKLVCKIVDVCNLIDEPLVVCTAFSFIFGVDVARWRNQE